MTNRKNAVDREYDMGADRNMHGACRPTVSASLIERARSSGAERLWLLTTGAGDFFARLGWVVADRDTAPIAIRASDQFTTLCPASAMLMMRVVRDDA